MDVVNPFTTAGTWLVVTASGASHLIDSRDPDTAVTVTRLTGAPHPQEGFAHRALRRDGAPLALTAVRHIDPEQGEQDGIAVGVDMWLVLEPLNPRAEATIRRTTPVVRIDPAPDHLGEEEAPPHE